MSTMGSSGKPQSRRYTPREKVMPLAEVSRGCSSKFPTWGWGGWGQASHAV